MTDILLHSSISILLRHYQRCHFLQQEETNPGPIPRPYAENEKLWITQSKMECLFQILLLRAQSVPKKGRKEKCRSQRDWRTPRPSKIQQDQHINELTESVAACSGPAQIYTRWSPRAKRRNGNLPHS